MELIKSKFPSASILVTSISLLLLMVLLVSQQRHHVSMYQGHEEQQTLQRGEIRSASEGFRWSNELKGWMLTRKDGRGEKNDREEQSRRASRCLWPQDEGCREFSRKQDRIINQLLLEPSWQSSHGDLPSLIKIVPPTGEFPPTGQEVFLEDQCPFNRCQITYDQDEADAIVFQNSDVRQVPQAKSRRQNQVWIAYLLESPVNTFDRRFKRLYRGSHEFNWTATYRDDSDIITPYSMFVPFEDKVREFLSLKELNHQIEGQSAPAEPQNGKAYTEEASKFHKDLIRNKQKPAKVAWFASNCNAANQRLEYARELSRFIQVDIYGRCGTHTCDKHNETGCAELLNKDYKFYLAFENSNCRQYLTEKLFRNAYGNNNRNHLVVPIVMGAPKKDYELIAPPKSFIHVEDFKSPEELAKYLHLLDQDDSLYYSYFRWKSLGRFIETKFMCRLCALLHESAKINKTRSHKDLKGWWNSYRYQDSKSDNEAHLLTIEHESACEP